MNETITIAPHGIALWVQIDTQADTASEIEKRCDREFLQQAIGQLGEIEVIAASVVTSGRYEAPPLAYDLPGVQLPDRIIVDDLPPFCDIQVKLRGAGGHVAKITIWVPLSWNGRFLGTVGGGNRTDSVFGFPEILRTMTLPTALRNGFSTSMTDGANRKRRFADWGLIEGTDEIDWELTRNWVYRSTHDMTVIAKAVTKAIHGAAPRYSYVAGCSGGGRQALMEAQRYPEDYDGIWASDPAINWTKFIPAELWPALVMKEYGAALAPAKFEAFRAAAIEACDGVDGLRDGIIGAFDPCAFDARLLIGHPTDAGVISEVDANVMNRIWEGPRTRSGSFLWYGLRPGTESWGSNPFGAALCLTKEVGGQLEAQPFEIATAYFRAWLVKNLHWDWRTLTFEVYEMLFERSVRELSDLATDDPNLSAFRGRGGKLIISHGGNDQVIPAAGSVDYYRRVIEAIGSEENTKSFARLFITEGDGHGTGLNPRPGLMMSDAMTALMMWVEKGVAPDEIIAKTVDAATGAIAATRPVYAYPMVPSYRGEGNPNDASSFAPVHLSERTPRGPSEPAMPRSH
jgi:hypothetical protein